MRKRRNQMRSFNFSNPSMFPAEGCYGNKNFVNVRKKSDQVKRVQGGSLDFLRIDEDLGKVDWDLCRNPHFYAQNLGRVQNFTMKIERKFSEADFNCMKINARCCFESVVDIGECMGDKMAIYDNNLPRIDYK